MIRDPKRLKRNPRLITISGLFKLAVESMTTWPKVDTVNFLTETSTSTTRNSVFVGAGESRTDGTTVTVTWSPSLGTMPLGQVVGSEKSFCPSMVRREKEGKREEGKEEKIQPT